MGKDKKKRKKVKRPTVAEVLHHRDLISGRLDTTAKALVGIWADMRLDKDVPAEDREVVAQQAKNYALAARVVKGDINLELIQLPFPPHFGHVHPPEAPPTEDKGKPEPGQYL